jgi:glycosyltransferase involved in cell wall biosynthesis
MKLLVITQRVDKDHDIMGFFHGWLTHLSSNVDSLEVIANGVGEHTLPPNATVHSLGKEKGYGKIKRYLSFYLSLMRILPRVDGVFVHMCPEYVVALYPLNFFFRKPIVMWYAHVKVSLIAKFAISKVKKVLSPSEDSFVTQTEKLVATGHGIDTDVFTPAPVPLVMPPILKVFTISRISPIKNIEGLLETLNLLVHKHKVTNFHITIAGGPSRGGDEEYLNQLKEKVDEYKLSSFISWLGPVQHRDTPALYSGSDIFVRMQAGGGFGKTELEALSCGLPVVLNTPVYNVAFPDFAEDIYWVVGDSEMFAEKLKNVIEWSREKRVAFGKQARDYVVREHNLSTLAGKIVDVFDF